MPARFVPESRAVRPRRRFRTGQQDPEFLPGPRQKLEGCLRDRTASAISTWLQVHASHMSPPAWMRSLGRLVCTRSRRVRDLLLRLHSGLREWPTANQQTWMRTAAHYAPPGETYPQGESNPCLQDENLISWATRRWGPFIAAQGIVLMVIPSSMIRDSGRASHDERSPCRCKNSNVVRCGRCAAANVGPSPIWRLR